MTAPTSELHATIVPMAHWGSDTPLVGRAEEIARLTATIDRASAGEASATLLAGDAGVGKTRLIGEVISYAVRTGTTVLVGHCVDVGDVGLPYLPFSEILGSMAGDETLSHVLDQHPTARRLLRTDADIADDTETSSRLQLFDSVTSLFAQLAGVHPILLVIEDLHWADQSTRDLLRFILSRIRTERLTVLASYRADDLHRRHPLRPLLAELVRLPIVDRLQLGPMNDTDVASLVRALHPAPLSDADIRRIVSRAEGNAFYAEELLAANLEDVDTMERPFGGDSTGGLPSGLTDVLLTRLEQLPSAAQRVVRLASVAGRRVPHNLLRDAARLPDDELDQALREAVSRHLLMSEDGLTYAFRHALLQEAAYGDLLPGERARMHAVFANLLADTGSDYAAARAHHSRESHDLPGALSASLEAAEHAERVGAPTEQLRHLEFALDLWSAVPDAAIRAGHNDVVLMLRASAAAAAAGEASRAVALTRAALDRVSPQADAELAARVRYTLAKNLIAIDNDRAAYQQSTAALELIPADPPSLTRVWAATTHILTSFYADDIEGARSAGVEALAGAKALGALDAQADVMISTVFLETGGRDTPAGYDMLLEAYELATESGNQLIELRAVFNLAIGSYEGGNFDRAKQWCDRGLALATRTGLLWASYSIELRHILVHTKYSTGDWDGAIASANLAGVDVVEYARHIGASTVYVEVGRGDPHAGIRAEKILASGGMHPLLAIIGGSALIDEAMWLGNAQAALDTLQRTYDLVTVTWSPTFMAVLRLAALCLGAVADQHATDVLAGDHAKAAMWVTEADRLLSLAQQSMSTELQQFTTGAEAKAWMARVEAEHARITGADPVQAWRQSLRSFGFGHVYEQARSKWRLAEALLAQMPLTDTARAEASVLAAEAHTVARELKAAPLMQAVEALIRRGRLEVGARINDAVSTGIGAATLTPREVDVLALLARGHTNRQIGTTLYISAKTASVHVSNILAKLGAGSRAEAVTVAHRRGLISADA